MNSKLLVWRQKMRRSQRCYDELKELTVDDFWQITDAGDQELHRVAHSSRRGTNNNSQQEPWSKRNKSAQCQNGSDVRVAIKS